MTFLLGNTRTKHNQLPAITVFGIFIMMQRSCFKQIIVS